MKGVRFLGKARLPDIGSSEINSRFPANLGGKIKYETIKINQKEKIKLEQ